MYLLYIRWYDPNLVHLHKIDNGIGPQDVPPMAQHIEVFTCRTYFFSKFSKHITLYRI